ncbi:MAG: glycogen debranching enzyme N-terminal domain-containing protein [Deltaproteobacteria bacterium]|nr:glycogen debranching enzyme N-terminal domain-containing protein [Deltaproteobacteria bacterium]
MTIIRNFSSDIPHCSQNPAPGAHLLTFRGDTITFTLSVYPYFEGDAWLRTNIGHVGIAREEIIARVENDESPLSRDWFDLPMLRIDQEEFKITIPLAETGHFEAKAFFLARDDDNPVWAPGDNTVINVEPADTCCANIIYNVFVRQFGPNLKHHTIDSLKERCVESLDQADYTVIPPSGRFRDLIPRLDFIIKELGCRILQLLPIHSTPTTYARMGRFGSPYAALSFTDVDPALAQFDPRATPLEQFVELVDAVHERDAKIIIDIAINHTGWAADLHETHPRWLVRDQNGLIENPGAWGMVWEDLTKLDYGQKDLWLYITRVFIAWCKRGVDGFRCDAGYMIPVAAWEYIIAFVRRKFPDTIFFLEGLGGKISVTRALLDRANFNWAYSELFQNYDRSQVEHYLPEPIEISDNDGIMVNFAETHDNQRLASVSNIYAKMRTALCALSSQNGAFAFANGVEWYATEKIDVHAAPSLNWGAEINQVDHIRRLNRILKAHPAFYDRTDIQFIHNGYGNNIVLLRRHRPSGKMLIIPVNLDHQKSASCSWKSHGIKITYASYFDLLTGEQVVVAKSDNLHTLTLKPGQVLCLTSDKTDIDLVDMPQNKAAAVPDRIIKQRLKAKAMEVFYFYNGNIDIGKFDPDAAASDLSKNIIGFCRNMNPFSAEPRVIPWQWPNAIRREVMIPPGHFLIIKSPFSFRAVFFEGKEVIASEESIPSADGSFFALCSPFATPDRFLSRILKMSVYKPGCCSHDTGHLLFLPEHESVKVKRVFNKDDLSSNNLIFLGTNGRGGMLRSSLEWGRLDSKYDALLAANINSNFPEDRWILLTRCRIWVVFQGYSHEIGIDSLSYFMFDFNSCGLWRNRVPTGRGKYIYLQILVKMIPGENSVDLVCFREHAAEDESMLPDHMPVRIIIRPDIENRNFHKTTKAYLGPEHSWPASISADRKGFKFVPDSVHRLHMKVSSGGFVYEPEWHYMVNRPNETERGLDPDSDLFSPGYFSADIKGGAQVSLVARITPPGRNVLPGIENEYLFQETIEYESPAQAMQQAVDQYIVKRGDFNTVIAGYPWFLDWGRDTLIVTRGLIAAGRMPDAGTILKQFASYEEGGTLPNMIRGDDAGNRETSDAPLWFFAACADFVKREERSSFLETLCKGRSIKEILISMARSLMEGTFNGIAMDRTSGLLFSPAHFTWMDTNYPAGTPREGYPVEIQALWFSALSFLAQIDSSTRDWQLLVEKVRLSFTQFFYLDEKGYLADCLHAAPGEPAASAAVDDALRPNQLIAITMGLVSDLEICAEILFSCQELLVPGAIRSLADRPVAYPLEIKKDGNNLNDPYRPYKGVYAGDEDTERKPAYHNGTAWTWMFPFFCEAWSKTYGSEGRKTALAWLAGSVRLINAGCVGHLPEILDGDFPHKQRGCDAQAWGASEFLRVWLKLNSYSAS